MNLPVDVKPLSAANKKSFAYLTIRDRLPVIITRAIDSLSRSLEYSDVPPTVIISQLSKLKYELERDKEFETYHESLEESEAYNQMLEILKTSNENTWFSAPWMFSECSMYHKIHEKISLVPEWQDFDVFAIQKYQAFNDCIPHIHELMHLFMDSMHYDPLERIKTFINSSLWGNQMDLSLFKNISDVNQIKSEMNSISKHIIVNDVDKLLQRLKRLKSLCGKSKTIIIILDNAGYELVCDLCLSLVLIEYDSEFTIILECKTHPWFVSDTTIRDINWTFEQLIVLGFNDFVGKLRDLVNCKRLIIKDDIFWTTPLSFWNLNIQGLFQSGLVIFKGDLNYRKMVNDAEWPTTTLFKNAIGPISTKIEALVMLRTCKSDVAVGLLEGQEHELNNADQEWMVNGKWGMIQYHEI